MKACGRGWPTASPASLIFFFLFAHVLDTALVRVSPEAYNDVIETYKNPIVGLARGRPRRRDPVPRVQRPAHHPVDFWSKGPRYQRQLTLRRDRRLGRAVRAVRHPAPDASCSVTTDGHAQHPNARDIHAPRDRASKSNFELYSLGLHAASGVLLVVLVFGHLFVNLMLGEGVHRIDFAFVAGKWASPFWQIWDLLMLWLASCTAPTACARSSTTTPSATAPASGSRRCSTSRR